MSGDATLVLGIDVGASSIKGAPVDLQRGDLVADRYELPTPKRAKPREVSAAIRQVVGQFKWSGPLGVALPLRVQHGIAQTAGNFNEAWIGTDVAALLGKAAGHAVTVLNDADAAGIAEMHFGAGNGESGVVILLTFGTGVGSALFVDGALAPNTALGELEIRAGQAGLVLSKLTRSEQGLSWKRWAKRVNQLLERLDALLAPDLYILGGGASDEHEKFLPRLRAAARIVPARLENDAGIVGAALAAARSQSRGF